MQTLALLAHESPEAARTLTTMLRGARRHHAYLLVGGDAESGAAWLAAVARELVCTTPERNDGACTCPACRKLDGGNHPDVHRLAPSDKGRISIDAVRAVTARLGLRAAAGDLKVVLIDRADTLAPEAQNALLKTLEEPPGDTCFVLGTHRPRRLLSTVRSRCQVVRLSATSDAEAWRALVDTAKDENLARHLAAAGMASPARAEAVLEAGAGEHWALLTQALAAEATPSEVIAAAAELGSDRDRADLALRWLEVMVRDALAKHHGARDEQLHAATDMVIPTTHRELARAAQRLVEARRTAVFNPNRALLLESIFFTLRGALGETRAP